MALPRSADSQAFRFTKVLDNSVTLRPDGEPFGIAYGPTTPAFDGKWVVFRDPGPANNFGAHAVIWSFNTLDRTLRKLVDLKTAVPAASTMIQDLQPLDTAPTVRNGTVVFVARDSSSGRYRQGLYSAPAAGGLVQRIADYDTWGPNGGRFTLFDTYGKQVGAFSFDGVTVAFTANESAFGAYSAAPDGSALNLIADSLHPYTTVDGVVSAFYSPVISGRSVVMIGVAGSDPRTAYNGIYLGTVGGNGRVIELLNSRQPLPDNSNTDFHTRYDAPVLAFDGTLVVFRALDMKSRHSGLYYTDLASHTINKIADVNSELPGLGELHAIAYGGVAVSNGMVLFKATDISGASALFQWRNGTVVRVIGKGDRIDGQTVEDVADPGPAAIYDSSFVLNADLGRGVRALYVATAKRPHLRLTRPYRVGGRE
jgi:hypothetical protein